MLEESRLSRGETFLAEGGRRFEEPGRVHLEGSRRRRVVVLSSFSFYFSLFFFLRFSPPRGEHRRGPVSFENRGPRGRVGKPRENPRDANGGATGIKALMSLSLRVSANDATPSSQIGVRCFFSFSFSFGTRRHRGVHDPIKT